jgi:hypothetical protein
MLDHQTCSTTSNLPQSVVIVSHHAPHAFGILGVIHHVPLVDNVNSIFVQELRKVVN